MDLEDCVRKYINEGYTLNDARSKVSQDDSIKNFINKLNLVDDEEKVKRI